MKQIDLFCEEDSPAIAVSGPHYPDPDELPLHLHDELQGWRDNLNHALYPAAFVEKDGVMASLSFRGERVQRTRTCWHVSISTVSSRRELAPEDRAEWSYRLQYVGWDITAYIHPAEIRDRLLRNLTCDLPEAAP